MCSHYQAAKIAARLAKRLPHVAWPEADWGRDDMFPDYPGLFIRKPPELISGDDAVPEMEAVVGRWGMIAPGTRPEKLKEASKLSTSNARSERASKLWTFRLSWERSQHCLIPAEAFYEPDWREESRATNNGRPVPTRFTATDGEPMMIAGLWDRYRDAAGQLRDSYTMLTINADNHELMRHYHRPGKEKRMVVVLPAGAYQAWMDARPEESMDFMVGFPPDSMVATPEPQEQKVA